ncbi:DUF4274 domain-containing protein [Chryseobacterium camelliae]|uniref:DUF4274 domain-containing protein n=1 Tax=Chryseobacterium camelliae TaxID=1265445 RepID=A0ABY7QNM0_9FLAO|nr:DUF4274 domain-containing protein [Chryseobacterium camelliae]WBV61277.1 DUF4274 domain-containing protein [Chryseobacterium camelliae]
MIVKPSRENFIKENFFELSFRDKKPDFEKFKTLSSAELHYLTDIYNWDDGAEVLFWVVNSNKCDKATALMIFWRACPDYYLEKAENELEVYELEVNQLLKTIIESFKSNKFKRSVFSYNPQEDFEIEEDQILNWNIPVEMTKVIKGFKPIYLGTILKFLKSR